MTSQPGGGPSSWENYVVVQLVQALLGLVSENVAAIAAQISTKAVVLHFAVKELSVETDDDIDHVCFELDVLLDGKVRISSTSKIGTEWWPPHGSRRIYRSKANWPKDL